MARYKYVCANGHAREVVQAMADFERILPERCVWCDRQMVNVMEAGGVQFMNGGGLAGTRSQT